tara:strand:- start:116 stop:1960 length:1845 start_codon:yes stop_codon:yes gene_type:complete
MKNKRLKITMLVLATLFVVVSACKDDDTQIISDSLRVLTAKVNEQSLKDEPSGVDTEISLELVLSHSLNTAAFESALSISSSTGEVSKSFSYSNSNSIVTITNTEELDFETEYTISIAAGEYGENGNTLDKTISYTFTVREFVPPNVTLSRDLSSISEAGGVATITATMSEAVNEEVTVNLTFAGTAGATDYLASGTSIVIPGGQLTGNITVTAIDDAETEGLEDVIVSIESVTNAIESTPQEVSFRIEDNDAGGRGFIINEVLFDPASGDAGDANGDGIRSASEDEFIEFVNDSDVVIDLSGFTVYDTDNFATLTPRHTFPNGTIVPAHGVYVLFGGGTPSGNFGGAAFGVSTTGNLNLNNAADQIIILDASGNEFLTFDTAVEGAGIDFGSDQSVTRSPDITGDFTLHTTANASLIYSPGTMADGTAFDMSGGGNTGLGLIINEVLFDPASGDAGDANRDGTRSASEDEFIEFVNDSNSPIDLSGFTLYDDGNFATLIPRHTFPNGTVIPAHGVYVLFGGGAPAGDFGNAQVGVSTTGNMNLNNAADKIIILDASGNPYLSWDSAVDGIGLDFGADQSITRSPDITGSYVLHQTANGALSFSPGKKADGTDF